MNVTGWRRSVLAAGLLLVAYGLASLLSNTGGYLGTDTGAKALTLEVMDRAGTSNPDVGYWAEEWDPNGVVHPLYQAYPAAEDGWVAVTTLPMLQAARPLYALGGYRATLLLPMLGSLGAAFGARAIARRLGDSDGWTAFWVTGLASPMLLYALDFWEHSLGVAAVVGAIVLLLDVIAGRAHLWRSALAGVLFGGAATLRTEAVVYAVVAMFVTCVVIALQQRRLLRSMAVGAISVIGFAIPWLGNRALEVSARGLSRTERATGTAERVGSEVGQRIEEGLVTLVGVKGSEPTSLLIGLGVVAAAVIATRAERRGDRTFAIVALVLAAIPYIAGAISDLSFVPGLFAAFPLALAAFFSRPAGSRGVVVAIAVLALPVVWAFQYLGAAGPQWGGRYTLASAVLLGGVGTVGLVRVHPVVGRGLIALSGVVALISVVWLGVRSNSVDDLFLDLKAVDADVLIARNPFLVREGGAASLGERWLSVNSETTFTFATEVAERSGAETVAVAEYDGQAPPDSAIPEGWRELERSMFELTGTPVGIVVYDVG